LLTKKINYLTFPLNNIQINLFDKFILICHYFVINIFKKITLTWWQAALYETSVVSLGILIGIYFAEVLNKLTVLFWFLFIVPGIYIINLWLKSSKK